MYRVIPTRKQMEDTWEKYVYWKDTPNKRRPQTNLNDEDYRFYYEFPMILWLIALGVFLVSGILSIAIPNPLAKGLCGLVALASGSLFWSLIMFYPSFKMCRKACEENWSPIYYTLHKMIPEPLRWIYGARLKTRPYHLGKKLLCNQDQFPQKEYDDLDFTKPIPKPDLERSGQPSLVSSEEPERPAFKRQNAGPLPTQ